MENEFSTEPAVTTFLCDLMSSTLKVFTPTFVKIKYFSLLYTLLKSQICRLLEVFTHFSHKSSKHVVQ